MLVSCIAYDMHTHRDIWVAKCPKCNCAYAITLSYKKRNVMKMWKVIYEICDHLYSTEYSACRMTTRYFKTLGVEWQEHT